MTGGSCKKSPHATTETPPNGSLLTFVNCSVRFRYSLNVLSPITETSSVMRIFKTNITEAFFTAPTILNNKRVRGIIWSKKKLGKIHQKKAYSNASQFITILVNTSSDKHLPLEKHNAFTQI